MEGFIYAVMILALYFAPTLMARKGRRASVFVINAFLGFTLIGWVVALFMAIRSQETA